MSTIYLPSRDLPEGYGAFNQDEEPEFDHLKIDNIEFEDIDYNDYPDFCDAYISYAEFYGRPLTDEELEIANDDKDFFYDKLIDYLY